MTFLRRVSRCIHSHGFFSLDEQARFLRESVAATGGQPQKWCLEHGVLKWAEAETLCKKIGVTSVRGRRDPTTSCVLFNMKEPFILKG